MKTISPNTDTQSRLFGIFTVLVDRERQTTKLRLNIPRLLLVLGAACAMVYVVFVAIGYVWLHQMRKVENVEVLDVALLRVGRVKHKIGENQFAQATQAWKDAKYQAAYIAFLSGVRNAPDFVSGRLEAASFLVMVGLPNLAVITLEEGWRRSPADEPLMVRTLDLLTGTGRDREALRLLREPVFKNLPAERMAIIHMYELYATLNLEGAVAAKAMLDARPEVRARVLSAPVVARVLWASGEKAAALELLQAYIGVKPKELVGYSLLMEYQLAEGKIAEAQATSQQACTELPSNPPARLLRLDAFSANNPAAWKTEMEGYLTDFRAQPQALALLAELAGKKGWVLLTRGLYEASLGRDADARIPAMFYAEALFRTRHAQEALDVLAALERQSTDESGFMVLLRQRQIVFAAAIGKNDEAQEYARRLASSLSRDPERLESTRRRFAQVGLTDVAALLVGSAPKPRPAAKKS